MNRRVNAAWIIFALLGFLLLLELVLPLVNLLGQVRSADIRDALADAGTRDAIRISLETSLVSTALMTLLGVPLACVLARASRPWRRIGMGLILLPLVMPPLVGGVLLLLLFGPYGLLGRVFASAGIVLTGNFAGIVLSQIFAAGPFVVVASYSAFRSLNPRLEQAAALLGDSAWETFRRISLPLAWPGIAAGIALGWIRALGEFGATLVMAYSPHTVPIYLWVQFQAEGLRGAFPLALFLLATAVAALGAAYLLERLADDEFRGVLRGAAK